MQVIKQFVSASGDPDPYWGFTPDPTGGLGPL